MYKFFNFGLGEIKTKLLGFIDTLLFGKISLSSNFLNFVDINNKN